eukprot:SAG25_NODE_2830_length_1365_cov_16.049180_1_plen_183_part_10
MVRKKPGGRHMAATATMTAGTPMILLRLTCWQRRPCALVGVVHRCRRLRPHTPAVTASEGAAVERPRGTPSWQVGSCRGRWHRWHRLANGGGLGKSTAALVPSSSLAIDFEISALKTRISSRQQAAASRLPASSQPAKTQRISAAGLWLNFSCAWWLLFCLCQAQALAMCVARLPCLSVGALL